jgi:N4-gp56 family major capsid protein
MAAGGTTSVNLANSLQRYFSRDLLDRMIPTLIFADYALKSPLPAKAGAKTMRLFRFDIPTRAHVQKTDGTINVEGVPMTKDKYRQLNLDYVDADLSQYVQTIAISDVADATTLFDLLGQANMQNAEDAALHCDALTQFELATTTGTVGNVNYANKLYEFAQAAADYAAVYNLGVKASTLILQAADILDAATALKVNKAPKINGSYVMACPPQVTRDIMAGAPGNTVWLNAAQYSAVQQLFNGEVGKLYGVRVVEHNNPYQTGATAPGANPEAAEAAGGIVHHAFVFGRQAYGLPDLSTLGSPYSPAVFVVTGADKADPANQIRAMVSWKAFWAAKLLQPKWLVHLMTQSGSNA